MKANELRQEGKVVEVTRLHIYFNGYAESDRKYKKVVRFFDSRLRDDTKKYHTTGKVMCLVPYSKKNIKKGYGKYIANPLVNEQGWVTSIRVGKAKYEIVD